MNYNIIYIYLKLLVQYIIIICLIQLNKKFCKINNNIFIVKSTTILFGNHHCDNDG